MRLALVDCQFAWLNRWNGRESHCARMGRLALRGRGEGKGILQVSKTTHLSPRPWHEGRGEKGRR
jgi:hypothetical protein